MELAQHVLKHRPDGDPLQLQAMMNLAACYGSAGRVEEAVAMYLNDEIGFYDIYELVSKAVDAVPYIQNPTLEQILETDSLARQAVRHMAKK